MDFSPLTEREIECIRLSRSHKHAKVVAEVLGIAKRTVDFHLSNAYAKLGVTNKWDAIHRCEDLKLLSPRGDSTQQEDGV